MMEWWRMECRESLPPFEQHVQVPAVGGIPLFQHHDLCLSSIFPLSGDAPPHPTRTFVVDSAIFEYIEELASLSEASACQSPSTSFLFRAK